MPSTLVAFGEILWDVLPSGPRPGGAPVNVAYHAQKLGFRAVPISRTGKDPWGTDLRTLLQEQGITTEYLQEDGEHPTGLVQATIGADHEVSYDIVYPSAWDFIGWEDRMVALVREARYFVFGSLITRSAVARATLLRLIGEAEFPVLDINLRAPHYSRERIEELLPRCRLLKLNEHELPLLSAWYNTHTAPRDQVADLSARFGIGTVVVTRGGAGALLFQKGSFAEHQGFTVEVADTVGSGDAFLAGLLSRLAAGDPPEDCLRFANALGAFTASRSGAWPAYAAEEISERFPGQ
ncbi:MAG TPA: carbohydrate kinase [Chitinophagaceae bacterium]|jgi:fructokinase|nr:carbohydrate kinase [Chitinophagaceae bacterium]